MSLVSLPKALELLNDQGVVALPTETVYGLAGAIDSQKALELIFKVKKRPYFDPLIVHVHNLEQAESLARWDNLSRKFAQKFWPGPLTLILPKTKLVSSLITAGKSTVALRIPGHPLFLEILKSSGTPLAAPSANRFGKISPTTPEHVLEEFNSEVPVLDGGSCKKGIESTIVEVITGKMGKPQKVCLHRPGALSRSLLKEALIDWGWPQLPIERNVEKAQGPGQLENHYQPDTPFVLCDAGPSQVSDAYKALKAQTPNLPALDKCSYRSLELTESPEQAARVIYGALRQLNALGLNFIFCPLNGRILGNPSWEAILDRLKKASHCTTGKNLHF